MYDLLLMDFQFGIFDATGIHQFVDIGTITEAQYVQITGQQAPQSSATQPVSSAPNSSATQSSVTN